MVYQDDDDGPFYMTLEERQMRKEDHRFGTELKDLTLPELKDRIREVRVHHLIYYYNSEFAHHSYNFTTHIHRVQSEVELNVPSKAKKADYQDLAQRNGISIVKVVTKPDSQSKKLTNDELKKSLIKSDPTGSRTMNIMKKIKMPELISMCEKAGLPIYQTAKEGWRDKPKGLLQICYERGLLDLETYDVSDFTVDGKKNKVTGVVDKNTSLRMILSQCEDFQHEVSLLVKIGRMMGLDVRLTPKTHSEIAGEAIEYDWASSKNEYRRYPMKDKRGRAKFYGKCGKIVWCSNCRNRKEECSPSARLYRSLCNS